MNLPKFNRYQVPRSAGASAASHVLGASTRKGILSEGDGTSLRVNGGNDAKKDNRITPGSAPHKSQPNFNFSFGQTGLTGRS